MTFEEHELLKNGVKELAPKLKDPASLKQAIELLDNALNALGLAEAGGEPQASPYHGANRVEPIKGIEVFGSKSLVWTPGTFLLHDAKLSQLADKNKAVLSQMGYVRESTPILCVKQETDLELGHVQDIGSAHTLVVERITHQAKGPILPDLLQFHTTGFPTDRNENFVKIMQHALQQTRPENDTVRYRWWVEKRSPDFPRGIRGRSAQVAAACCMLALNDPNRIDNTPLLDDSVAVTACLGRRDNDPEKWEVVPDPDDVSKTLERVEDRTLREKFAAAASVRLIAVLVCDSQLPDPPEYSYKTGDEKRTVLIQPVSNLAEAYDSLLITSKAVAAYKESIVEKWNAEWRPEPTPPEFRDGR